MDSQIDKWLLMMTEEMGGLHWMAKNGDYEWTVTNL